METTNRAKTSKWKEAREWLVTILVAVVVSLLFQNYVFAQVKVEQHSMEESIHEGERLIENKFIYRFTKPKRGDIVIIEPEGYDKRLIKRVIGLPGETVELKDGRVYIDGVPLEEPYAKGETHPRGDIYPFVVPEDSVFVLGDNREVSLDSRNLGAIPYSDIEGKAVLRIWPLDKLSWTK